MRDDTRHGDRLQDVYRTAGKPALREPGYETRHLGINLGWGWTKDSGKTYVVAGDDLFAVLDQVTEKLEGKRILDFSEYEYQLVGLPYQLDFRRARR